MTFRHHLGKIIKIVATRGQILRLKYTKYYFGWGSAPDPTGGDYSGGPEPLAGRGRSISKGDGEGREKEWRGLRKGRVQGKERKGTKCSVPLPTFE